MGRDEAAIRLAVLLLRRLRAEENIDPTSNGGMRAEYFCQWCAQRMPLLDGETICAEAEVPVETWDYVQGVVNDPAGADRLGPSWTYILLADRPDPKHKLANINVIYLFTFEDGVRVPIQVTATPVMIGDRKFTDAVVGTICQNRQRDILEQVMEHGLDGIYDKHGQDMGGDEPFGALMQFVVAHIKTLPPEVRHYAEKYGALFTMLVKPLLPANVRQVLAAQRAKQERPSQEHSGGWDS